MARLDGKVALVTGSGPNIGLEVALELARNGASVACNDIDPERARAAADAVRSIGGNALPVPGDITNPDDVQSMVQKVIEAFGAIHVLVNNAAITVPKGILNTSLEEWRRCIDVILTGAFLCSQAVAKHMVEQGIKGVIINVVSTSGHRGRPNALAYCAAKGGLLNMTRAMACDLAPFGIRVNSVSPTKTGTSVGGLEREEQRSYAEIPLGRLGRPIDQAKAICFLASDDADFITGADLRVDGGALATWGVHRRAVSVSPTN